LKSNNYVWYASYGSNLSKDRFKCYIDGGTAMGADIRDPGCRDSSPPLKDKSVKINNELVFTGECFKWSNKGVAVIDFNKSENVFTYARMYLITKQQFIDIVKQENGLKVESKLNIDFDYAKNNESEIIFKNKMYGRILYVGQEEGYPIFSFTTCEPISKLYINEPSKEYLQMIGRGLKESHNLSKEEIVKYFISHKGVKNTYTEEDLIKIL